MLRSMLRSFLVVSLARTLPEAYQDNMRSQNTRKRRAVGSEVRFGWSMVGNSSGLPRQPIRTCRSRTAPCRSSGACPRPHSAGRRWWTPCRSWGRTGFAHRLPRWTATRAARIAWSASSRLAKAGVGRAQGRRVQAHAASLLTRNVLGRDWRTAALPRTRHGRPKRLRRVQEHAGQCVAERVHGGEVSSWGSESRRARRRRVDLGGSGACAG
jgi:hypothetical protein